MREARIHVRHVRDLLKSLDPTDAYNGIDCNSLSFLNAVTQGDILGERSPGQVPVLKTFLRPNDVLSRFRKEKVALGIGRLYAARLHHAEQ